MTHIVHHLISVSSDASVSTNAIPSAEAGGIDRTLSLGKRFMVTLVSTAAFTKSDAEHLAAAWRLELESRGIEIIIEVVSEKRIVITVPDEDVNTVISYIAQQPQVHWFNYRLISSLLYTNVCMQ